MHHSPPPPVHLHYATPLQVPLAIDTDSDGAAGAGVSGDATAAVVTLQDADMELQNWTFVADGQSHSLFPAGVASGQVGTYALTEGGCSDVLDYRPLAVPHPPLAAGNYSVCEHTGDAPAEYIGFALAVGPVTFRTAPSAQNGTAARRAAGSNVCPLDAPCRVRFYGMLLERGDAWAPSGTGDCSDTLAPQPVGPVVNGSLYQSTVEAVHPGLGAGTWTVCYFLRPSMRPSGHSGAIAMEEAIVVEGPPFIGGALEPGVVVTAPVSGCGHAWALACV